MERLIGGTAVSRSDSVALDIAHPARQWVPTGENLVHQPSLGFAELWLGKPSAGCRAGAAQPLGGLSLPERQFQQQHPSALSFCTCGSLLLPDQAWTLRNHDTWSLHVTIEFASEHTALRFEQHLKSGSGRESARRHFE
jgi:hypothetical protein